MPSTTIGLRALFAASLVTIGTVSARADPTPIPELAPPLARSHWEIEADDAHVIGDDEIGASTQSLNATVRGRHNGWVASASAGIVTWQHRLLSAGGGIVEDGGIVPASPRFEVVRWFGRPRPDGGFQVALRGALMLAMSGVYSPAGELRITATPWDHRDSAAKLALGARLWSAGAIAVQVESGVDLRFTNNDHNKPSDGLWVGAGGAFQVTSRLAMTLHAVARWVPGQSEYRRTEQGLAVGVGGLLDVGPGRLQLRIEVRPDNCEVGSDASFDRHDTFCGRLVAGYSQPFGGSAAAL